MEQCNLEVLAVNWQLGLPFCLLMSHKCDPERAFLDVKKAIAPVSGSLDPLYMPQGPSPRP
jgi:hypothetical protein